MTVTGGLLFVVAAAVCPQVTACCLLFVVDHNHTHNKYGHHDCHKNNDSHNNNDSCSGFVIDHNDNHDNNGHHCCLFGYHEQQS